MGRHSPGEGRVLFVLPESVRPESGADEEFGDELAAIKAEGFGVSAEAHAEISDLVHQERTADAADRYREDTA